MTSPTPRAAITLENWRSHPASCWSFQHACELVPSATIAHGSAATVALPPPGPLAEIRIGDGAGGTLAATEALAQRHTDSLLVLRHGKALASWSAPHSDFHAPHLIFSISKSITGLAVGIAEGEGRLDPEGSVAELVASMGPSTYGSARLRHLLDMTVDLAFDEDYVDHGGAFDRYRRAMLWNPERPETRPETMEAFLATLPAEGHGHGKRFHYASPNSDLLGIALERAVGQRLPDYLGERLWRPLGLSGPAYVTVDRVGTARAAGGICLTITDLAQIGQLLLDRGRGPDGRQIVPAAWIDDMRNNGDRRAWVDGDFADMFAEGRYRSCWYDVGDGRGTLAAIGIHGQYLWVDFSNHVVIARTASRPQASDDVETQDDIAMMAALARSL
ncbi:MAG: beta-lactamase family protein [Mesorhizobium sp.]|nr:beta-lactamase family protein [Mesorhizobium sp.]